MKQVSPFREESVSIIYFDDDFGRSQIVLLIIMKVDSNDLKVISTFVLISYIAL